MFDVRRGEGRKVILSVCVLLLIVAAYTIVKAVRDAVFLSRFGVTEMSIVAIGLAVLAGTIVGVQERVARGLARPRVIGIAHGIIALSLAGLWFGLRTSASPVIAWVLYIWSSLFGVFIVAQFWLLASELFDVREAKRMFAVIGSGAILGGLLGGVCAQFLAARISAGSLLLLAASMLLVAAGLASALWRHRIAEAKERQPADEVPQGITALLSQPGFVRVIALCLLLSTVATTLVDWQLKVIAKHAYAGHADQMTALFGAVFAYQSVASLVFQLAVTGWLLRRFGVGVGRAVLPLGLFVGSLAVLGHAALPLGVLAVAASVKVAEGGLRFAVDKAAAELTWLPLPRVQRDKSKSFVDTVVDRIGTGVTGALWLGIAAAGLDAPSRVHWVSAVVLAVVAGWLWLAHVTQQHYVNALRQSLAHRRIDLQSLMSALGHREAQRTLSTALASDKADQVQFGLFLLAGADQPLPDLAGPLSHPDAEVRLRALGLLTERSDDSQRKVAEGMLEDDDVRVREAAIAYLGKVSPESGARISSSAVDDDEAPLSRALIALSDPANLADAEKRIARALLRPDAADQIQLLGAAPPEPAARLLRPLLHSDDPAVVTVAMRAAGRAGAIELTETLADLLDDRHWRPRAARAIADMGAAALERLVPVLAREDASLIVRHTLVRLFGASRQPAFADHLAAQLDDARLRGAAIRALSRLHAAVGVRVPPRKLDELLHGELKLLYQGLVLLGRGSWPLAREPVADEDLFHRAVREDTNVRTRRCFALLSMMYNPSDVRSALRGIQSPLKPTRAKGVEFLDNLLQPSQRDDLLPAIEDLNRRQLELRARRQLDVAPESKEAGLRRLLRGKERWLRLVACWKIGHDELAALRGDLEQLHDEDDPSLAPVVQRALERLDQPGNAAEPIMGLTVVEKALKLRAVDVLADASSEDLAYVAQIAEEREVAAGTPLYQEGDAPDALYIVISGEVDLIRGGESLGTAGPGEAFGSWALVDESPRVAGATSKAKTTLLTVGREDFGDLLADRPDIVQAVFRAMVQRIRALAELAEAE